MIYTGNIYADMLEEIFEQEEKEYVRKQRLERKEENSASEYER